jgi:hypothetical protein
LVHVGGAPAEDGRGLVRLARTCIVELHAATIVRRWPKVAAVG